MCTGSARIARIARIARYHSTSSEGKRSKHAAQHTAASAHKRGDQRTLFIFLLRQLWPPHAVWLGTGARVHHGGAAEVQSRSQVRLLVNKSAHPNGDTPARDTSTRHAYRDAHPCAHFSRVLRGGAGGDQKGHGAVDTPNHGKYTAPRNVWLPVATTLPACCSA